MKGKSTLWDERVPSSQMGSTGGEQEAFSKEEAPVD